MKFVQGLDLETGSVALFFEDAYEAQLVWSALDTYLQQAKQDMQHQYENRPGPSKGTYGDEDDMFLGDLISKVAKMKFDLHEDGFNEYYGTV